MKSRVLRTAVLSSAITTVLVTALTLFALPKVPSPKSVDPVLGNQPAVTVDETDSAQRPSAGRIVLPSDVRDSSVEATADENWPVASRGGQRRSKAQSAAIIAGSAGTGAAIGAIAKGGKGAAIGAIAGGVAGFIYDRITADEERAPAPARVVRRR